jgi:putative hydrolase of the HAD superfamily
VKAVLFDLDDTLYPERTFVHAGFEAAAVFLAPIVERPSAVLLSRLEQLHDRDGRGRLFDTLLGELEVADEDRVLATAAVHAYRTQTPTLEPFPDAVTVLEDVRAAGMRTGLVSDGLASVQRRKLSALPRVGELLDVVVLTDELGPGFAKPSPVPFLVACRLLDMSPADVAYVGNDPRKDFTGARAAGLRTFRVGSTPDEGGATIGLLAPPDEADTRLDSLASLPAALGIERGR